MTTRARSVILASLVGTAIEFYDFFIYGTAAALVFSTVFFAEDNPLGAYATFAVAFLSRPLGSAIFGHWGDRAGRKSTLVVSLLLMGGSTVAIGVLPGYAAIGVAAPILLTLLRFTQGIGLGGEWGGAALLAAEYAPEGRRGRYAVFPQLGPPAGFLLANGAFLAIMAVMDEADFRAWGWRLPFLASLVLVLVGLYVRLRIAETPVFLAATARARVPLRELPWGRVLLGAGAMVIAYTLFYVATTYCLSYGTAILGVPKQRMLALIMLGVVFMAAGTVVSARLSDRFGRRRTLIAGTLLAIAVGPFIVWLPVGPVAALGVMGLVYGPMGAYLPELFRTECRYSGASVSYALGGVLGGAVPPLIATLLGAGVGWYVCAMAVLSLLCLLALPETADLRL
ncbi:MFS transporter [Nonomuraea sp. NPDC050556]|uniref:MFS transporter n=1 Tax=Nonomuraea sp. NPDC050556 TaxID=3364369 RepID=UPI003796B675